MRKRFFAVVAVLAVASFIGTSMVAVNSDAARCNKCKKKDGCPSGHCYVDCEGCCFEDPFHGVVCYR